MSLCRSRVFPALAGLLWAAFLLLDLVRLGDSTWIKFAGICLCGITALSGAHTFDGKLVAAALCLTVGADWFLLVRDDHYLVGMGLFLAVQGLYALRLHRLRGTLSPLLLLRGALLLLWGGGPVMEPTLLPLWTALLYFSNLCLNTVEAFALGPSRRRFAWGLLLFICCDICVGAWNVSLFLPSAWAEFARVGMWLFYLPSQVLIVLSQEQEKGDDCEKTV